MPKRVPQPPDFLRDGRTSAKDSYDPEAWKAWDNTDHTIKPGRPYDGAIVKDGRLVIPKE